MQVWRHLVVGLRRLARRASVDKDTAEEVRQYFEEAAAAWVARGLSPEDAKRAAVLESGKMAAVYEQVRSYGWENSVIALFSDFRYALRQVVRNPGFAIVSIFTLALGIGAATAIFSVVKAVILNPLPFRQPQRLVHLWEGVGDERYHMGDEASSTNEIEASCRKVGLSDRFCGRGVSGAPEDSWRPARSIPQARTFCPLCSA
jgi:putative ABC transport system permease protein